MSLTTTLRAHRPSPARPPSSKGRLLVLATVVVGGLALLGVSQMAGARRQLLAARTDLGNARQALSRHDETGARATLDRAGRRLADARRSARSFPLSVVGRVPLLGSPARAATGAADAGLEAVAAGRVIVGASSSFPTSATVGVDGHDLSAFHDAAARSVIALGEADDHLAVASAALDGPSGAMLPSISRLARDMHTEVADSRTELAGVSRGLSLLEDLTAPGTEARLLLLSQDSLELRATGGYIGSYGVLVFSHGTVQLEKYESAHDLPPPEPPLAAPAGLAGHLPSYWSLTNVNWWPDFPTSAAAAAEMYRRQAGGEVDGVLALTEAATARLVGAVGPLTLPSYAKPVVEEGFDLRVVQEVELKHPLDIPRKKFLIELSTVLFDKLFHLPADRLPMVTDAVRRSLGPGDVQLWFKDPARQGELAGTAVESALPHPDGDFLMSVDSNMVASKANLDVTKQVDYRLDRDRDGRLVGHVRIVIRNQGKASPINPLYTAYLRIYVPAGSELIPRNLVQTQAAAVDGPFEVFSQPLTVKPEAEGETTFDYVLPDRIAAKGPYHLTWVRQVGTPDDRLQVTFSGRTAEVGAGARTLEFEADAPSRGLGGWLRQRWVVKKIGLG